MRIYLRLPRERVAYIVKSAGAMGALVSPLARAPFDRQRDVYKLALMNSGDCKRMWNSFAAEAPHMARLVVADVERERREDAAATEKVDKRLREAERVTVKARKPKVIKSRKKSARPETVRDALRSADMALRLAEQESCNPLIREWARMAARE